MEALWDERGWIEVSVVFGARVLQARVLRSLPSGVVAERVGWRPERLSRLERRDRVEVESAWGEREVRRAVMESPKVQEHLGGREIQKFVFIPGRLVNLVTRKDMPA